MNSPEIAGIPMQALQPLLSALVYVVGALLLKRAAELGTDVWRTARICNFLTAAVFAPLLLLGGVVPSFHLWWHAAAVALLFLAGQVLSLLALRIGDVSVVTPVLGVKIILVALLTTLVIGQRVTTSLWAASILSTVAIGLLHFAGATTHHHVRATILLAGFSATAFALFDVLVQKWAPAWGTGRFLPLSMGFVALFSIPLRLFESAGTRVPQAATRWVLGGAACFALQAVLFVSAISLYGQATLANVLYSSRGLWSVLAVWCVGHWFGNREHRLGPRVLAWRLVGAVLLLVAILLVLFRERIEGGRVN